ncbi:hypothetical protein ACT7DL_15120 [Bacillus paranthracis]
MLWSGSFYERKSNLTNYDDLVDESQKRYMSKNARNYRTYDYYLGKIAKTKDVHPLQEI